MPKQESLPSQDFIAINEIKNDVLFLKNGGIRKVLLVSGINTELKSEEEQNTVYFLFQNFLNSVDFPVQFAVHSRKLNVRGYLEYLESRREAETNELLKSGIEEYIEFVKSFVQENAIMTKNFFVVVGYNPLITSAKTNIVSSLPLVGKKNSDEDKKGEAEHLEQLSQRTEQVISGLHGIGLRAVALNSSELTELFFNLYNPETTEKKISA